MRKSLLIKNGLSLTELLIVAIIAGIVGIGIVVTDSSMRQMQQGASRDALVASRTTGLMMEIAKRAEMATGHANDLGIRMPDASTLCIRSRYRELIADAVCGDGYLVAGEQCDDGGYSGANDQCSNTCMLQVPLEEYLGVITCYTQIGQNIHRCRGGWTICTAVAPVVGQVLDPAIEAGGFVTSFERNDDPAVSDFYLDLTLRSCFDNTQPCQTPLDQQTNPRFEIHTQTTPQLHSF